MKHMFSLRRLLAASLLLLATVPALLELPGRAQPIDAMELTGLAAPARDAGEA